MAAINWRLVLLKRNLDATKVILSSEQACAIDDMYPKAQTHFLVLPINEIKDVFKLQHKHLPLLEDMLQLAKRVIAMRDLKECDFIFGFLLHESMYGLTMHVISKDFYSYHLKKSRHWINFHTPIFTPYNVAYGTLKVHGAIGQLTTDKLAAMRNSVLQCCQCDFKTFTIRKLKFHYLEHWINQQKQEVRESTSQLIESNPVLAAIQTKLPAESKILSQPMRPFNLNDLVKTLPTVQQSVEAVGQKVPEAPNVNISTAEEFEQKLKPYLWQYKEQEPQQQMQNQLAIPQVIKIQPDHPSLLQMPPLLMSPLLLPWYRQQPHHSQQTGQNNNYNTRDQVQQTSDLNNCKIFDQTNGCQRNMAPSTCKASSDNLGIDSTNSEMAQNDWSLKLIRQKLDSTKHILSSEQSLALHDRYPKAQTHFLVLPKIDIDNIFALKRRHLPLLEDMLKLANRVLALRNLEQGDFLFGFKLDALMKGLTMHIISKDFVSDHLKSTRHWINFHTPIFMPYIVAFNTLNTHGAIEPLSEEKLKMFQSSVLQCNQCSYKMTKFHKLKEHLLMHWQKKSAPKSTGQHTQLPASSDMPSQSERLYAFTNWIETLPIVQQSGAVDRKLAQNRTSTSSDDKEIEQENTS